jgi:hypothetical protein
MRKIYNILFAVLLFLGCSKDKIESLPNLSATLNNKSWSAFTIDTHIIYDFSRGDDDFEIRATTKDEKELYFIIRSISSGKYDTYLACNINYLPNVNDFKTYTAKKGEFNLSVDTVNHQISGTFDFVMKNIQNTSDSVVVKNGSFNNLKYTVSY